MADHAALESVSDLVRQLLVKSLGPEGVRPLAGRKSQVWIEFAASFGSLS